MSKKTARPAFPVHPDAMAYDEALPYEHQRGMTLRQWYAGIAMQGILAGKWDLNVSEIVEYSWIMAGAMLDAEAQE